MGVAAPVLKIDDLRTVFGKPPHQVIAVDSVSLSLAAGETLGIVGESGSGKSVTALSILRLLPAGSSRIESGQISFLGRDLVRLPARELRRVRGKEISMIFQEPGTSLNPVFTVADQMAEAIRLGPGGSRKEIRDKSEQLLHEVGIRDPLRVLASYPHQISGGQKQRVMIAMALSSDPKILIADEPTTALDVTVQAQILDLLRELRDRRGMSIIFISHDLGVISQIADHVLVMYRGKIVENAPVLDLFRSPKHPYTKGLLACRPRLAQNARKLTTIADFMELAPDGITLLERTLSPSDRKKLESEGRPPLLHPGSLMIDPTLTGTEVSAATKPILEVNHLCVHFPIRKGVFRRQVGQVKAVDGISFKVYPGQTLGLVGESGCGKTTTGRAILRLVPTTAGEILFEGRNFLNVRGSTLRQLRRRIQVVFQDPYSSLNPRLTVEAALIGPMRSHGIGSSAKDRRDRAATLMEEVGLSTEHLRRYPHEFSGGQRQRICIARSLAVEPDFLICDESVSALDVSVQAQILNLFKELQSRRGLTYIFISHDLAVVKFMADMMAVMNGGKLVEMGPAESVYRHPQQDYTKRLIAAIPDDSLEMIESRLARRRPL
ncbi:ABC transporter ATP-binding protein [bacterium]|nr:ABC transporter ATP-binding protein [bacterium]